VGFYIQGRPLVAPAPSRRAGAVLIALVALTGLLASACSGTQQPQSSPSSAPIDGGTLRIAIAKQIVTLDPAMALDNYSQQIVDQIFDTLTTTSATGDVQPRLATAWTGSADSRTWDVTLRSGVKFTNGRDLTADDVVWTMNRLIDTANKLPRKYLSMVTDVTKTGGSSVRFTLNKSYAPFPALLANRALSIVPKEDVDGKEASFARSPVGSGPFKFASWTPEAVTLERNPSYFLGVPHIEKVAFTAIPEASVATQALQSHSQDVISTVVPDDIPSLQQQGLLQVAPGSSFSYVVFNQHPTAAPVVKSLGHNPFTDPNVRKAISLAFDANAAVNAIYPASIAPKVKANGPIPNNSWAYNASLGDTAPKPNLDEAKSLMAAAGYPQGFSVGLLVVNDAPRVAAAQILQEALAKINITATISTPQIGQIISQANAQTFDIGIFGWGGLTPDPDDYLVPLLSTANRGPGGNNAYYSNPQVDQLITQSLATSDQAKRTQIFNQIQKIVQDDYIYIPLFYQPSLLGVTSNVHDLKVSSDTFYHLVTANNNVWLSH
jgi:peptide/nickel transport system substrate-binding protein